MTLRKGIIIGVVLALAATLVVLLVVRRSEKQPLPAPARTVQAVLELRAGNSTNLPAYERAFEETGVAATLVEEAAKSKKGTSPIPEWESPKVVSSSDGSATVAVKWKLTNRFKGWPVKATFVLHKVGDRWVIVDALEPGSVETTGSPK